MRFALPGRLIIPVGLTLLSPIKKKKGRRWRWVASSMFVSLSSRLFWELRKIKIFVKFKIFYRKPWGNTSLQGLFQAPQAKKIWNWNRNVDFCCFAEVGPTITLLTQTLSYKRISTIFAYVHDFSPIFALCSRIWLTTPPPQEGVYT